MWIKILLIFFTISFLLRSDQSFNQDLGRHLKLGEIILQGRTVPTTNLFSYTNPDFPFINTHWLFEVFIYLVNQVLGVQPLLYIKVIIILLSVWITLKIISKENRVLLLPVGFIFFHVLRERTDLRPEIFSFLFTAVTYFILESSLRTKRGNLLFFLPLIQLIWINTHIYFFVGLVLQVIFLLHTAHLKLRSHISSGKVELQVVIFILSVLISFINPNGMKGFLYPLNVTQNYGYNIVENQTMFFLENLNFKDPNFLFVKMTVGIILFSILVTLLSSLRKQGPINNGGLKNILLSLTGLGLALLNVRSFPYLVFLSLPAVMANFGEIKRKWFTQVLLLVTCVLLLLESYFYLSGNYYKYTDSQYQSGLKYSESSKKALDFVLSNNLAGPVFNNFDIGSYIIYRGYLPAGRQGPDYRVFIDGRPEAYPASFIQGIYVPAQYDYGKFKILNQETGFKTIIFSHTDQTPWAANFLKEVIKDLSWSLVYVDDYMVVLIRHEDLDMYKLQKVDLAALSPNLFNFENHVSYIRMAIFLSNTGYIESAGRFIAESLKLFPGSPVANSAIGNPVKNYIFW